MTLSIVRPDPSPYENLERVAESIASSVVDPEAPGWNNAFHHAMDLLAYARGIRATTRCMAEYEPDEIERRVEEMLLAERMIWRGMRGRRR